MIYEYRLYKSALFWMCITAVVHALRYFKRYVENDHVPKNAPRVCCWSVYSVLIEQKRANWSVMPRSNETCVYLSCGAAIGSKSWLDLSRCLKEHKNSKWRCVGSRDLGQKHPIRNQAGKQNRAPQGPGLQKRGYTHFDVARRIPLAV